MGYPIREIHQNRGSKIEPQRWNWKEEFRGDTVPNNKNCPDEITSRGRQFLLKSNKVRTNEGERFYTTGGI